MKKKRVLALFLAFSMALSSNGFTALAAENDSAVTVEADSSDETDEETVSEEGGEIGNGSSASEDGDKTEDGSDVSDENDATGNGNDSSGEDGSAGSGSEVSDGTDGSDVSDETVGVGDANEEPVEGDEADNADDTAEETDGDIAEGEETADGKELPEEAEAVESVVSSAPLIRTFTDETGMVVTYNANETYEYEVDENHVLKRVYKSDGTPISGTVALQQQDGEDAYYEIAADVFKIKENAGSHIEYVIVPEGVETIGKNAFADYSELKGITLPASVNLIDEAAFKNCTKLTQLSVPKAVEEIRKEAFYNDTSLFMVFIKDSAYSSMERIGDGAFFNCQRLEKFGSDREFLLPGYLKSIGESAFENCYSIKKLVLPDSVLDYTKQENSGGVVTETVEYGLGERVFMNCIALTEVTLSGVALIPKHAFDGCKNLLSVKFMGGNEKIDEYAFANCAKLSEVIFSYTVSRVENYAFTGCGKLRYVEFPNASATIGNTRAFPNTALWMRGFAGTEIQKYAEADDHNNIHFIAYNATTNEFFKYTYECLSDVEGIITFTCSDKKTDPNKKNSEQGIKAGAVVYVFIVSSSDSKAAVELVEGSLRCNGNPINKDSNGDYTFKMPVGGAYVTAEFQSTSKIDNKAVDCSASDVDYELSNGAISKGEASLKIGQTTRLFLLNTSAGANNSIIPASKVDFTSSDKKVASVSADGTIKALKKGTAYITATVYVKEGEKKSVTHEVTIHVDEADVTSIRLKPSTYDTNIITVDTDLDNEIGGVSLRKSSVETNGTSFTLLATAYDINEDDMSVALKWSTSDSKVAKLAYTSTKDSSPQNTITIPKGASGEATILVTATNSNPTNSELKTITKKFKVRVMDKTPRLSVSTVTFNPYKKMGAVIELISAYEADIEGSSVRLCRQDDHDLPYSGFRLDYDESNDEFSSILKFNLISTSADIKDGNYPACVEVSVGDGNYYLPLTIKVKRSIPNPTVKIPSNQKMNFFYHDGGTDVIPAISKLGDDIITSYSLENLTNSGDDSMFTGIDGNFDIDSETGAIIRSDNPMYYNSKNKPVVTGYLVLTFDEYKEGFNEKKYKITIPNMTKKPSYKLERTSDTFKISEGTKTVELALLDSKTKKPIALNDPNSEWTVVKDSVESTTSAVSGDSIEINENGKIRMEVNPNGGAGKLVLAIHNDKWDDNQYIKYKYTIKVSSAKTVFRLSKSVVTLNKYFADNQVVEVTLKSNQYGVDATSLDFEPPANLSEAKEEQYGMISIDPGETANTIKVSLGDSEIKSGTYKYSCYPLGEEGNGNKVTLTVRVVNSTPKLSVKGTASLNWTAGAEVDVAELPITIRNLPSDCQLKGDETVETIEYDTNKEDDIYAGSEGYFNFSIKDNKLKVSLNEGEVPFRTYTFRMTPVYEGHELGENEKQVKFKVKVYSKAISVSLKAKGKVNLLERYDESYYYQEPEPSEDTEDEVGPLSITSVNSKAGDMLEPSQDTLVAYTADLPEYVDLADTTDTTDTTVFGSAEALAELVGSTEIKVNYEYVGDGVESLKMQMDDESAEAVKNGEDKISIDESNQTTNKYVFTATAKADYEILSIKAYDSNDKDGSDGWSNATAVIDGDPINQPGIGGNTGTLTIGSGTTIDEIENGEITIVVVSAPITQSYTVTIDKPEVGVVGDIGYIKYSGNLHEVSSIDDNYTGSIKLREDEHLIIQVVPEAGYTIVVGSKDTDSENELEPLSEDVTIGELNNLYKLESVSADTTIVISAAYDNGKPVTFVRNGEHAKIKKTSESEAEIEGDADTTDADGYSFVVETDEGYGAVVEAYVIPKDSALNNPAPIEIENLSQSSPQQTEEGTTQITYTITEAAIGEAIDEAGDEIEEYSLNIIVTDIYEVTIEKDDSESIIKEVGYNTDGEDGYTTYDFDMVSEKPSVEYDGSLYLKLTLSDEAELSKEQTLVVKYTYDGETYEKAEFDSESSDENAYFYVIDNIEDVMTVYISIETNYTVTLDGIDTALPEGVTSIKYAEIKDASDIETAEFKDNFESGISFASDKKIALKISVEDSNCVVNLTLQGNDEDGLLTPHDVEGDSNYYFIIDMSKAKSDIILSIEVEKAYTITFEQNGSHAVIKVPKADQEDEYEALTGTTDNTDTVVGYKFDVAPDSADYGVKVEAYTTENKKAVKLTKSDANTIYTIAGYESTEGEVEEAKIEEDVTIVVTDIYTVTITNNAGVENLSYQGDDDAEPRECNSGSKPTVLYGGNLKFKFTNSSDKMVAVIDKAAGVSGSDVILGTNESASEADYTLNNISDNKAIDITAAYNITENIKKDGKNNDTASITYLRGQKVDKAGNNFILQGESENLQFKVVPEEGYRVTKVSYIVGNGEAVSVTKDDGKDYYEIAHTDISGNLKIVVETDFDANSYTIRFNVIGATVAGEGIENKSTGTETVFEKTLPRTASEGETLVDNFTFVVTPNAGNKLRYVGTDEYGLVVGNEISVPEGSSNGTYKFTLPENAGPITNVYVKASPLHVEFKGLTDNSADSVARAYAYTVTPIDIADGISITMSSVPDNGEIVIGDNTKINFTVESADGYTLTGVKINGESTTPNKYNVYVGAATETQEFEIYTINLTGVTDDVIVDVLTSSTSQGGEETETPEFKYTLKNSIVYTPVVSNLKDKVVEAKIFDLVSNAGDPSFDEESEYFNVNVVNGLLYVMPKEDVEEEIELENNHTYQLKVWLKFSRWQGDEAYDGGIWVNKPIKIKTAQALPKVVVDNKTPLNLYQSNTSYEASFIVSLKEGSKGELEDIAFGEKDTKADESFELSVEPLSNNRMKVIVRLKENPQYAANTTNNVKMYVKFKNQAKNTAGTPITMKINIYK
ncbi:MAG: leucine-rich repeat protein [Lachnospiraceae bacterium]|nr:leucine-rich repeat protein [Lachnospiraceae bacterium]